MLEKAYEMRDLLARHVKGETLSAEELLRLDQWLQANGLDRETAVQQILQDLALYTQQSALFNQSKRIPYPEIVRMNVYRRVWMLRIAAAVVVLIVAAIAVFYSIDRKPQQPQEEVAQYKPDGDIAPATSKATLTLADNSIIELGTTGQDTIAQQGGSIVRSSEGELVYAAASDNATPASPQTIGFNTLTTPEGGFYKLTLPDGSAVWLNAASSLKYPPVFNSDNRIVELTGEGYFEIKRKYIAGKRIPFSVKTAQGIIEVTGTRFNVNAYQDAHKQVTTLVEGSVTIHASEDRFPARQLLPGQKAISFPEKAISIQPGNVQAATGWMNGWFTFEDAEVKEMMQQIARWYGVEVKYGTGIPTGPVMNGSIERNIPLSNLLIQLESTVGENLQFRAEGKQVFVSVRK